MANSFLKLIDEQLDKINDTIFDKIKKYINNIGLIKIIRERYDKIEYKNKTYIKYILIFVLVGIIVSLILKTIKMAIYFIIFGIIALGGYIIYNRFIKPKKNI